MQEEQSSEDSVWSGSNICYCSPECPPKDGVTLSRQCMGYVTNRYGCSEPVTKFTWSNDNFMSASVMTYGATITNIYVPNKFAEVDDICLGFDTIEEYIANKQFVFGATIGRCANVIADAEYEIRKCNVTVLTPNLEQTHHMNGGERGFGRVNWKAHVNGSQVIMSYVSDDGEEGYPGVLMVQVMFTMTIDNSFVISYMAQSEKITPVNLSTRIYLNLAGHSAGPAALMDHVFNLNARKYIEYDADNLIPTGNVNPIGGTDFDCRICQTMRQHCKRSSTGSLHNAYIIHSDRKNEIAKNFVSRIIHPDSGRVVEIYSTQRCVELSSCHSFPNIPWEFECEAESDGEEEFNCAEMCDQIVSDIVTDCIDPSNFLRKNVLNELIDRVVQIKMESDGTIPKDVARELLQNICDELKLLREAEALNEEGDEEGEVEEEDFVRPIRGKSNAEYKRNCAFSMQTQNFPDAVHHRGRFGDVMLRPGEFYRHEVTYKFGLHMGDVVSSRLYVSQGDFSENPLTEEEIRD